MPDRALGLLLLRLVIAGIFLWHGVPKALHPASAMDKFVGFGLPGVLGPVTGVAEVVAGVALATGFLHRWAAAALLVIIAGALVTVQIPGGVSAGLERDVLIFTGLLVLVLRGDSGPQAKKFSLPGRSPASARPPSVP